MADDEPTKKPDPEPDPRRRQWSGEERRRRRSSFVERIGRARARRASDREQRRDAPSEDDPTS